MLALRVALPSSGGSSAVGSLQCAGGSGGLGSKGSGSPARQPSRSPVRSPVNSDPEAPRGLRGLLRRVLPASLTGG